MQTLTISYLQTQYIQQLFKITLIEGELDISYAALRSILAINPLFSES